MKHSEEIKDLVTALSKFQGEVKGVEKDTLNPFFKKKYADLNSCWDCVRKPLADNGLCLMQFPGVTTSGDNIITSILAHSSGQYFQDETRIFLGAKQDAQAFGSAVTYARRYAMMGILGLTAMDEDDDGNKVSNKADSPDKKSAKAVEKPKSNIAAVAPPAEVVAAQAKDSAEVKVAEAESVAESKPIAESIVDKAKAEIDSQPKLMLENAWASIKAELKQFELDENTFSHWLIKTLRANNLLVPDDMANLTIASGGILWKIANASNKAGELLTQEPK